MFRPTLSTCLKKYKSVKVGYQTGGGYIYCGESKNFPYNDLLQRVIIEVRKSISYDEPNTHILRLRGFGKGKYWTIKEYKERNKKSGRKE